MLWSDFFECPLDFKKDHTGKDQNDNMKNIIPNIQYATVEIDNEFANVTDDNIAKNNLKHIIPNIQYSTVEVNNEFAGINEDGNDNMKNIVPDIQYATVEIDNEFANITDDDISKNNNLKHIIPNIQYSTVEVNNEFASVNEDEEKEELLNARNNPRVVKNGHISIPTSSSYSDSDSDVQELNNSQELMTIQDSFRNISNTYREAIRGDFVPTNIQHYDTLKSSDSILHKLRKTFQTGKN